MSYRDNLITRIKVSNNNGGIKNQTFDRKYRNINSMKAKLDVYGGSDQWVRMREDKLRSLKKALLYSYQRAIVQKYDVKKGSLASNLINIITMLQDQVELTNNEMYVLQQVQSEYEISSNDRTSEQYIKSLEDVVNQLTNAQPCFKCLINHDKLKVDYQDKILSIPFQEPPQGSTIPLETDFHNGTVFKWVHGNKEEWTPDTYWIVYMQHSEETAFFRAEIRKADEQIQIVTIDDQGNESTVTYRGWMTGPNETSALWNIKKDITWNDLNYTKLLYITKDEDTLAFFQRFDRIVINGKPWEVQAYNESYGNNSSNPSTGIIRVALKETYTNTDNFISQKLKEQEQKKAAEIQYDEVHTDARIEGSTVAYPFDVLVYKAKNFENAANLIWTISDSSLAKIKEISQDNLTIKVQIITQKSNKNGFDINFGDSAIHVSIKSL